MFSFNIFKNFFAHICIGYLLWMINFKFAASTLIDEVCSDAFDPGYCSKLLRLDPRTRNAGLNQLGEITMDMGLYKATETKIKIEYFSKSTTDEELKKCLANCADLYQDAVNTLKNAPQLLRDRHLKTLSVEGSAVYAVGKYCENGFQFPPAKASPLKGQNYYMKMIGQIIANVAFMLQ